MTAIVAPLSANACGCRVGVLEAVVADDLEPAGLEEVLGVGRPGGVVGDRPHVGEEHAWPLAVGRLPGVAGVAQLLERLGETGAGARGAIVSASS